MDLELWMHIIWLAITNISDHLSFIYVKRNEFDLDIYFKENDVRKERDEGICFIKSSEKIEHGDQSPSYLKSVSKKYKKPLPNYYG